MFWSNSTQLMLESFLWHQANGEREDRERAQNRNGTVTALAWESGASSSPSSFFLSAWCRASCVVCPSPVFFPSLVCLECRMLAWQD